MATHDTSATYIGINNENEFYSHHYLSEVFKGDIKQVLAGWQQRAETEESFEPPHRRLRGLARDYFAMREQIRRGASSRARIALQRDFFRRLLPVFGLPWQPHQIATDDGFEVPVLAAAGPHEHAPDLLVLGAFDASNDDQDPLAIHPHRDQFHGTLPVEKAWTTDNWNTVITSRIYGQRHPPRWVLLLSDAQLLLIDRLKWNQNRLLRFDWDEILGRKDDATLKATAVLLHRESLLPDEGASLLDTLDENAHKHAFSVSEDLKYALREAIELLGNEAASYLIQRARDQKQGIYSGEHALDPAQLSLECLRYMYRLLFLFYIEARPDLGYVPMKADAYRKGYSLESLRDLEMVRLTSEESRSGAFFHQSIQRLFRLIYEGYHGVEEKRGELALRREGMGDESLHNSFAIDRLDAHLFDPAGTPNLNKVIFRNDTLQRVIELMSLTRSEGNHKRRGRISYAQLGINQLGAVYEALLSYRGFFAASDLYEVKKAGTHPDELETGYFVPAEDLDLYKEDERVYDKDEHGHNRLRCYPKGTFIYRLAGRDRQKSASYYTPEVLTKTLVKYALKELIGASDDPGAMPADAILKLTICEPAMGSAAFLNEAVNQLAEAYLERKQAELGRRIPHEEYAANLQRVKMHIADRNTFGVDLNPVAVELAEVSLWLNAIHGGTQVPWFGYQLFNGNSLIGARRQVYDASLLKRRAKGDAWYNHEPVRLDPRTIADDSSPHSCDPSRHSRESGNPQSRKPSQIYHFLLPDPGMANYNDKTAKSLRPAQFAAIKKWRAAFCQPFSTGEIDTLQRLSAEVDKLWAIHARQLKMHRDQTEDEIPVWPQEPNSHCRTTTTSDKDRVRAGGIFNLNADTASAYRRLKMAMDYWCALWFWPIDRVDALPSRDEFLMEIQTLLLGNVLHPTPIQGELSLTSASEQTATPTLSSSFPRRRESTPSTQHELTLREQQQPTAKPGIQDHLGQLNLERLFTQLPRLQLVHELSERHRFFHWELTFADVFADNGGFDLILGNPPWLKVEWQEAGVLGDFHPLFNLRKFSATKLRDERQAAFEKYPELQTTWFTEYEQADATQSFLNATQNYPLLKGVQTNLYKCFLPQAWMLGNKQAVSGFLHPEGVYDDPKGGRFRAQIYPRLKAHFQFHNEMRLFAEVHHATMFSINIFGKHQSVAFTHLSNLFATATVDASFAHNGEGAVPGIKNDEGKWNTAGHAHRIIAVSEHELATFAKLYDEAGTPPLQARLPALHARELIGVLDKFARQPKRLGDLQGEYYSTVMFDETYAQRDGTIRRQTCFPESPDQWILSGPHFFVGNPCYKTPRAQCTQNSHYDILDLTDLPDDYLPRTNYIPACTEAEYRARTPRVPWIEQGETEPKHVTEYYRFVNREMVGPSSERTMISTMLAPGVAHINTCLGSAFRNSTTLLDYHAMCLSIPVDYRVKSTGMGHANTTLINQLPVLSALQNRFSMHLRALSLNCLTTHYADLWHDCWQDAFTLDSWTKSDPRLPNSFFHNLTPEWQRNCALRSDYARRQALVEIDVLAALALSLTLEELLTIYRVQFPVMRQYEADTFYDATGRIVFTASKGLTGVGLPRKAGRNDTPCIRRAPDGTEESKPLGWEEIRDLPAGFQIIRTITDDTLPGGPREKQITYTAPFDLCDREDDYRQAWAVFEERGC